MLKIMEGNNRIEVIVVAVVVVVCVSGGGYSESQS